MTPNPRRVAARWASANSGGAQGRSKTAGEIQHIKSDSVGENWGWPAGAPTERDIPRGESFVFNPKFLKPLAGSLRSALMALGHASTAYQTFTKIKSRNISPDGALGGKGYIQKIPVMRKQLMNCMEALSAFTDTVYDELQASHWSPVEDKLDARDRQKVRDIVNQAEEIREDPEAWAEGVEEDLAEDAMSEDDEGSSEE
jgi:hypothetical protein